LKKNYITEINFLRFFSITAVIIYHYFPSIIPKGYLGVDLFFVISGFLISLYLYREINSKNFRLSIFYNRRIKRIIPATIFLLFFVSLIAFMLFTNVDLIYFSKSLINSIFFSSNFYFWLDGGYFGPNDKLKPLLHFWSLSVEEQFYIFFPLFFYFIIKNLKSRTLIFWVILVVSILSLFLNIFLINFGGSNPAFFLLPTRIWNFGFGILAMLIFVSQKNTHNNLEIFLYILFLMLGFFYKIPYLPENFLIIFFSFMILQKKIPKKFVLNFLIHNKLVQYIGIISFSLYLWHWPLLVFLDYYYVAELKFLPKFIVLILSILFSILSYHLIEFNFRYKYKIKNLFKLILVSYFLFISFFLVQNLKNEKDYKKNSPNYIAQANLTNYKCETVNFQFYFGKRGCLINDNININNYEIALIGNSHAQMYVPSINPHLKKFNKKAILLPMQHCLPTLSINLSKECIKISKEYFSEYSNDDNVKTVIIATSWWHDEIFDGSKYIEDPQHKLLAKSLIDLIENLKAKEKRVFLVGPIQVPLYELPQELSRLLKFNHIDEYELLERLEIEKEIYEKEYNFVNELFNQKLGRNFLQMDTYQCDEEKCYYYNREGIIFADGSHISKYGANLFSKPFEIIFE
jgi:peptidoglycan/LPS O-acetylase OafA/YrhL